MILAGLKVGGIPFWRLIIHDWSKFFPKEYFVYRRRFTGKGKPVEMLEWKYAWLHHIHYSPHHYEHWMIKDEPLPMPETYVREMFADWLAAGRSYQSSWDIQSWIDKDYPKMAAAMHAETIVLLRPLLVAQALKWPGDSVG